MEDIKLQRRTLHAIFQTLKKNQQHLEELGVCRIGLFGSYSRGTPSKDSDMDFLVQLNHPTFDTYMELKFFLEDLFQCKVDLVMEETLKPRLRHAILNEVVYAEEL